ncbi:MAG: tyrosine-type recombinase/integrase [Burkholderiales bacterium]|nr:tyrosine-type recombinase/integrase [Burkholderiales bacterium]
MRGWDQLLDGYMAEYGARGLSEESVRVAGRALERWGLWLKRSRPRPRLEDVDAPLIARYMRSRSSFTAKSTVYRTLSTLRGMGDYLVREGVWAANPMRWMKGPKVAPYSHLPARLGRGQVEAMWKAAAEVRGGHRQVLWVTVLSLFYGTGLRRGELSRLEVGHWDRAEGLLWIDGRKSGWERRVPVPELTYRCLETYLPLRANALMAARRDETTALLVGADGMALSPEAISAGVHRIARRAQVDFRGVHQFRHSCASDLLEAGVSLPEVQRILGHRVISTTVRYTHIADPQRAAALALHPINDWLGTGEAQ